MSVNHADDPWPENVVDFYAAREKQRCPRPEPPRESRPRSLYSVIADFDDVELTQLIAAADAIVARRPNAHP